MSPKILTQSLSIAAQISEADVAALAARGFRSLINNRPDHEADGQPTSEEIADVATGFGLAYRHLPVVAGNIGDDDVAAFAAALDELPAPILAFCRTGTRCTMLWALGVAPGMLLPDILQTAAAAGYDLAALVPRLRQAASA